MARRKRTGWVKLAPIDPRKLHRGCLSCSTACLQAPLDLNIAVGFGASYVTRDGEIVLDGEHDKRPVTVARAERLAAKDPDHDWQIVRDGPLHGETFQRHGKKQWVCVESNRGFA